MMKREIDDFITEITDNFAEIFTETFYIRFLDEFQEKDILKAIKKVKKVLPAKISNSLYARIIFK